MADGGLTTARKISLGVAGLALVAGVGYWLAWSGGEAAPAPRPQLAEAPALAVAPLPLAPAGTAEAGAEPIPVALPVAPQPPVADCTPRLALAAAPGAMLEVAVAAPCHPGARVVLRHAGLAVTLRTDARGELELTLPALDAAGAVAVSLPGSAPLRGAVAVPEVVGFDRIAVQWPNGAAFALRAEDPRPGALRLALGSGDVDWPLLAELRSYPAGEAGALALEAAVTAESCGRHLVADVLVARAGQPVTLTEVAVAMPDCPAAAGTVDLGQVVAPLTLARR
jgi:hypothetical protein